MGNPLEVQKYLYEHGLDALEEEFGLLIKRYEDRIVLNYGITSGNKFHPIIRECRGLILGLPRFNVLSRTFDRFYNYLEDQDSNNFNFKKATCYEKMDGSLIPVYHDGDKFVSGTRGTAFGEGESPMGNTFAEIFKDGSNDFVGRFNKLNRKHFSENKPFHFTFIFEVVSPETRVVKPYKEKNVYLLAIRDKFTGEYMEDEYVDIAAKQWKVDRPEKFDLNDIDLAIDSMEDIGELDEGYIFNNDGWRIKVKNPSYVAIHNLSTNGKISTKRIAILVFAQDFNEYLSYFPEDKEFFNPYIEAYDLLMDEIDQAYYVLEEIEDRKEFAIEAQKYTFKSFLFALRNGKDLKTHIKNMNDSSKLTALDNIIKNGMKVSL